MRRKKKTYSRISGEAQGNGDACQFQGEDYWTSKMFTKPYKMFHRCNVSTFTFWSQELESG